MVAVFEQMGVGQAAAFLIDAIAIRGVLLPAVMARLDDRNRYMPKWLMWLPDLTHDESAATGAAPAAGPRYAGATSRSGSWSAARRRFRRAVRPR